jgi:oligopeptide transport system substrate-binding protein
MDKYAAAGRHNENVEKAKALLSEAGYPDGKNFPKITVSYNTSEQHRPIAEAIQAAWKKNLGIDVELYNLSWPAYLDARKNKDFHIVRASWIADYRSPESFLNLFLSDNPINHSGWKSARFDCLLKNARTEDPNVARKNFELAETLLMQEAPLLPIYFYSRVYLLDERVKNWHDNPLGFHDYKQVRLEGGRK